MKTTLELDTMTDNKEQATNTTRHSSKHGRPSGARYTEAWFRQNLELAYTKIEQSGFTPTELRVCMELGISTTTLKVYRKLFNVPR